MNVERLKRTLQGMAAAAKAEDEPLDHILFVGPKEFGAGRLAETVKPLSQLIANELGANLRIAYSSSHHGPGDLAAILTHLRKGDIFFIDNILALDQHLKDFLCTAMVDCVLDIVVGKGASSKSVRLNLARFTVISTTTQPVQLAREMPLLFGIQFRVDASEPDQPTGPSDVIVRVH
jgi:holliday junction DNA helicase RuvB